jgi:hypothetical protein
MAIVLAAQEALVLAVQRAESPFCLLACGFVVYLCSAITCSALLL